MAEAGYERTGVQCRDKMKKLKSDYKKLKDNKGETGRRNKALKFYGCINEALHNKPATRLAIVTNNTYLGIGRTVLGKGVNRNRSIAH